MSDANSEDRDASDPQSLSAEIDAVCDRFEAAWKAGGRPRIEEFLNQVPETARRDLFRELLKVEIHWRTAARQRPGQGEYLRRFPDFAEEIKGQLPSADDPGGQRARQSPPLPEQLRAGDRNLLFGILALQMDFISRDALVAAMHAWVPAKHQPLGEILVQQNALTQDRFQLLDALVNEHLKQHGNDPEKSLAALSSLGSAEENLMQLGDADVNATLAFVGTARLGETSAAGIATSSATRFRILRPHAEGGLGVVSVARDEELGREVALKEIRAAHAHNPDSRARFLQEAEITGGLEHPGIVPVYSLGQYADGRPYYAMRFIRGDSLKEAIDRYHDPKADRSNPGERSVELRKLLGRFLDVCNAIAYAHSRGVLHRDLKPGNIMLGKYGETLVVDWGLAKAMGRAEAQSETSEMPLAPSSGSGVVATQMGSTLGTPQYMSPEQAEGRPDLLGPASDVYSLGATLYYLLTGKAPVRGDDLATVLRKVEWGDLRRVDAVNPTIPRSLAEICHKALKRKPEDRYATPRELADDLERWLADEPVSVYRDPIVTRTRRWSRKYRLAAGLIALSVFAVVIASVWFAASASIRYVMYGDSPISGLIREPGVHLDRLHDAERTIDDVTHGKTVAFKYWGCNAEFWIEFAGIPGESASPRLGSFDPDVPQRADGKVTEGRLVWHRGKRLFDVSGVEEWQFKLDRPGGTSISCPCIVPFWTGQTTDSAASGPKGPQFYRFETELSGATYVPAGKTACLYTMELEERDKEKERHHVYAPVRQCVLKLMCRAIPDKEVRARSRGSQNDTAAPAASGGRASGVK